MKKDIHPESYRLCVFKDMSTEFAILTKSCAETNETIKWEDGNEYPLYKLEISDKSHPYFTGKQNLVDSAGRIEKFNRKYKIFTDKVVEAVEEAPASEEAPADEVVEAAEKSPASGNAPDKEQED